MKKINVLKLSEKLLERYEKKITKWIVPGSVAVLLVITAMITKEVYSSLLLGIVFGALLYEDFSFEGTINYIFTGGIIHVLSQKGNVPYTIGGGIGQSRICKFFLLRAGGVYIL